MKRGWMYETRHTDGTTGRSEYTVWSEVFLCATCTTEIVFYSAGFNKETRSVGSTLRCQWVDISRPIRASPIARSSTQ